jgi:hypothetical protein
MHDETMRGLRAGQGALALAALAMLTACAPSWPTPDQARDALVVRMERPAAREVKVDAVSAFELKDCRVPEKGPGVLCAVSMEVAFTLDGEPMTSADAQEVRFVRESGNWVAYPE